MDYSDAMIDDNIMLEPRLQEYIKKKKYYENNNIEILVPLEITYIITLDDKKRIKKYIKGKTNLYSRNKINNDSIFIDNSKHKLDTSEDKFQKDPRFKRLQKKLQKQKEATNKRHNYNNMYDNYEMYTQQTPKMWSNEIEEEKSQKQLNQYKDDSYLLDDNPYIDNNKYTSEMTYHNEPKISYNNRIYNSRLNNLNPNLNTNLNHNLNHKQSSDKIIGNITSYRNKIPQNNSCISNRERENNYKSMPQLYENGLRNVDMESYIKHGTTSRDTKNMGYKNPIEHYYQYIDEDLQKPVHVINDRGIPTRDMNKKIARLD